MGSKIASIAVEEFHNLAAASTDAIKAAFATAPNAVTYLAARGHFNGSIGSGRISPPRTITITTVDNTDVIIGEVIVTGKDLHGKPLTEGICLSADEETVEGTKAFASVASIKFPAQNGSGGSISVGIGNGVGLAYKLKTRAGSSSLIKEMINGVVARPSPILGVTAYENPAAKSTSGLLDPVATIASPHTYTAVDFKPGGLATLDVYPRTINFTAAGSTPGHAPTSVVIVGADISGITNGETLSLSGIGSGTIESAQTYKSVGSVAFNAASGTDATIAVGLGNTFALTAPAQSRLGAANPIYEAVGGATMAIASEGTIVSAASSPPNGTYTSTQDPDGETNYVVYFEVAPNAGAVTGATDSAPNGLYVPLMAPTGAISYSIMYEWE